MGSTGRRDHVGVLQQARGPLTNNRNNGKNLPRNDAHLKGMVASPPCIRNCYMIMDVLCKKICNLRNHKGIISAWVLNVEVKFTDKRLNDC